jgi:hypothetical protein
MNHLSSPKGQFLYRRSYCLIASTLTLLFVPAPAALSQSTKSPEIRPKSITAQLPDAAVQARAKEVSSKMPMSFELNQGQTNEEVRFFSRVAGHTLWLTANGAVLAQRGVRKSAKARLALDNSNSQEFDVFRLKLANANRHAPVEGLEELPRKTNYFIGNDPKKWRTNVPSYAKVRYRGVYPGVDLVYYGNQSGQLEYDFVVAPGADPKIITLNVEEGLAPPKRASRAAPLCLDPNGDLMLREGGGDIRFQKPVVYQQDGQGRRHYIDGHYLLRAAQSGSEYPKSRISFEVAAYDHSKPLVIDPAIAYSTFLNGTTDQSSALGIATFTDPVTGHVYAYVAGSTCSSDFPRVSAEQLTYGGGCGDAFVAKFDPSASGVASLIYSTYLGGSGKDFANGIAVDSAGNAYVTGGTSSNNFPLQYAYQTTNKALPYTNAFVAKLSPDGSALMYSTYFGGSGNSFQATGDNANAIALDTASRAYIAGGTTSQDLPTVNPYQATYLGETPPVSDGGNDPFLAIFDTTKSGSTSLMYASYIGGAGSSGALTVAVDTAGYVHLGGVIRSPGLPVVNGFQAAPLGPYLGAAFYAKLNPALPGNSQLLYSTYLGGGGGAAVLMRTR